MHSPKKCFRRRTERNLLCDTALRSNRAPAYYAQYAVLCTNGSPTLRSTRLSRQTRQLRTINRRFSRTRLNYQLVKELPLRLSAFAPTRYSLDYEKRKDAKTRSREGACAPRPRLNLQSRHVSVNELAREFRSHPSLTSISLAAA